MGTLDLTSVSELKELTNKKLISRLETLVNNSSNEDLELLIEIFFKKFLTTQQDTKEKSVYNIISSFFTDTLVDRTIVVNDVMIKFK